MVKLQIDNRINCLLFSFLFILTQTCFCAMSGHDKNNRFLRQAESLNWDLPVDSAIAFFEALGCDSCKMYHRNNHLTVGPYVRCVNDRLRVGSIYNWGTQGWESDHPPLYYYFVTFPDSTQCLAFFKEMENGGYTKPSPLEQVEPFRIERQFNVNTKKQFTIGICNECNSDNTLKFYRSIP